MGFLYTIQAAHITVVNAVVTLLNLHAGTTGLGSHLVIHRMTCSQDENATSAMQRIQFGWKVTAFPTLVATVPALYTPLNSDAPASILHGNTDGSAGHGGMNASAEGAGAFTPICTDAFNALNGWLWIPTPEERIIVGPDKSFSLYFPVAALTLAGWNACITFEEC